MLFECENSWAVGKGDSAGTGSDFISIDFFGLIFFGFWVPVDIFFVGSDLVIIWCFEAFSVRGGCLQVQIFESNESLICCHQS